MNANPEKKSDLSAHIAQSIREAIIKGRLGVGERLPSESELAETFGVSRPTVREALKRLAAQSLIRTQRGAFGGAFVNRLSYDDVLEQQITNMTLLISMNNIPFEIACEARFTLEEVCVPLAARRRTSDHITRMRTEIKRQSDTALSDEDFCISDVAFHRTLIDAAQNPVLAFSVASAVEAMQPLMNMITFTARSRRKIIGLHHDIVDALEAQTSDTATKALQDLAAYTHTLGLELLTTNRKTS